MGLMTPVIKGVITDTALPTCAARAVFGATGYIAARHA